jgi:hypothetical protein
MPGLGLKHASGPLGRGKKVDCAMALVALFMRATLPLLA